MKVSPDAYAMCAITQWGSLRGPGQVVGTRKALIIVLLIMILFGAGGALIGYLQSAVWGRDRTGACSCHGCSGRGHRGTSGRVAGARRGIRLGERADTL